MADNLIKNKKTKFIFTVAVSGGLGKSISASLITETLRLPIQGDLKVIAVTCDPDHQDLAYRYGQKDDNKFLLPYDKQELFKGVQFIDFSNPEIRDNQFKKLFSYKADFVVVDFGAGQISSFDQLFGDIEKFKQFIKFAGLDITFVCPVKDEQTLNEFNNLVNTFGKSVHFIMAFNEGLLKATKTISSQKKNDLINLINNTDFDKFTIKETFTEEIINELNEHSFRELFTPRIERKFLDDENDYVYITNDSDYLLKDMNSQFILDNVLTLTTHQINGLFGLPQPYKEEIEDEMDKF